MSSTCDESEGRPPGGVWTFGYQIFRRSSCEGNPFGFVVKQAGMELEECKPLELPFVDNMVDFSFYKNCSACDESATLLQLSRQAVNATQPMTTTPTAGAARAEADPDVIVDIDDSGGSNTKPWLKTVSMIAGGVFALISL